MNAQRRLRAILRSQRALDKAMTALRGAVDGFWLGILDPRQIHALDEAYYEMTSKYHEPGWNTSGLLDWEKEALDRFFPRGKVVVTAVGGGREAIGLLQRGYEVVAFECNERLARSGNELLAQSGFPASIAVSPRDEWPDTKDRFDGAVVGWGSYMLIQSRKRRIEFLRGAHQALKPGAPILLSFFHRSADGPYFRWVVRIGNLLRRLRGQQPLERGDGLAPEYGHHFSREEIEDELARGGFELVFFETDPYPHAVGLASASPGNRSRCVVERSGCVIGARSLPLRALTLPRRSVDGGSQRQIARAARERRVERG